MLTVGCHSVPYWNHWNLLPSTLWGSLVCLDSHIPLLMKPACSLTLRTVGNEKWMKSFWNSVYDYHNTSTMEGVCLPCIVACNTKAMHYTKDTCAHVLQWMTIFALFSSLFNWYWSPVSCKGLRICAAEVIPLSFHFTVLPFNLAALKNWVLATTKRLDLAFCFISASCDPQGGSLCARLHCLEMGDCARALFVWLPPPHTPPTLLIALKSAWQFGSMALAPQELPSDKMSPWLCSTCPIGWPDALYTWQPDGQNTEQEVVWSQSIIQFY